MSPAALIDAVRETPGSIGYIGKLKDEKGFYVIEVKG
jgi:hypothetical protein